MRDEPATLRDALFGELDAPGSITKSRIRNLLIRYPETGPRTITTVKELDMLPDNSVIEDGAGDVGVLLAGNVWYPETAPIPVRKVGKSYLPATVLYEPQP